MKEQIPKQTDCCDSSEANQFIRFEVAQHSSIILPYATLLSAQHIGSGNKGEEVITLIFPTHTVTLRGRQLLPVLMAIQRARAQTIRINGGKTEQETTPTISDITITEVL